jgi:hypothetical protein
MINVLKKAVNVAKQELEIFSERLILINVKEQLNIMDIERLLVWENPNQE